MAGISQIDALGHVECSLGKDVLFLESFSGYERLHRLPAYTLNVLTEEVTLEALLGDQISVKFKTASGTRGFNGHVVSVSRRSDVRQIDGSTWFGFEIEYTPWLGLLEYSSDYRVYRSLSVLDAVREVFDRHSELSQYEFRTTGSYPVIDMHVQYDESDFRFVSRKLARHGLYYYFEHDPGSSKQTLIVTDNKIKHRVISGDESLRFHPQESSPSRDDETIFSFAVETGFRSGASLALDTNHEAFRTKLESPHSSHTSLPQQGAEHQRVYFPAGFSEPGDGNTVAQLRTEAQVAGARTFSGATHARNIAAGSHFTLTDHPDATCNTSYLVVEAHFECVMPDFRSGGSAGSDFHCAFQAIEKSVQYRTEPSERSATSLVHGVQTATVSGPSGKEIYTDKLGRVKLKFPWDRSAHQNENSSHWVRVSHAHAGRGFGGLSIPRIGEEVLVEFENGDPERPVVVGRVYNDANRVPQELPSKQAVSGVKSQSTTGGGGHHEMWFDDTKGEELINVISQKDLAMTVNNDMNVEVSNDHSLTVSGSRNVDVTAEADVRVGRAYNVDVGTQAVLTAGQNIKFEAGGSTIELGPQGISIKTSGMVEVNGTMIKLN